MIEFISNSKPAKIWKRPILSYLRSRKLMNY